MITCQFKQLTETAKIPTKAHLTDAGIDFYADENIIIPSKSKGIVSTGLVLEMKWDVIDNFELFYNMENVLKAFIKNNFIPYLKITSRSGLSSKHNIEIGAGVIDYGYRGEVKIILYNHSLDQKFMVNKGDKIAQGIVYILPKISIVKTDNISKTLRGENGFGSTGV